MTTCYSREYDEIDGMQTTPQPDAEMQENDGAGVHQFPLASCRPKEGQAKTAVSYGNESETSLNSSVAPSSTIRVKQCRELIGLDQSDEVSDKVLIVVIIR